MLSVCLTNTPHRHPSLVIYFFFSLSACLSVCLSVALCLCLSVPLSLSVCLSVCLSVSLSLSGSVCLSLSLSPSLSTHTHSRARARAHRQTNTSNLCDYFLSVTYLYSVLFSIFFLRFLPPSLPLFLSFCLSPFPPYLHTPYLHTLSSAIPAMPVVWACGSGADRANGPRHHVSREHIGAVCLSDKHAAQTPLTADGVPVLRTGALGEYYGLPSESKVCIVT